MRYSFKKDAGTDALGVYLNHNQEQVFVCWLYPHEVLVGERKTDAVDRMLFQAGYTGRLDFWETKKGVA